MQKFRSLLFIDDDYPTNYYHREIAKDVEVAEELLFFQRPGKAMDYLHSLKDTRRPFPEIIFLDINMPGIDGWEFAHRYGEEFGLGYSRIIILSTSFNPADQAKAEQNKWIHAFQSKPLTIEYLEELRGELVGNLWESKDSQSE